MGMKERTIMRDVDGLAWREDGEIVGLAMGGDVIHARVLYLLDVRFYQNVWDATRNFSNIATHVKTIEVWTGSGAMGDFERISWDRRQSASRIVDELQDSVAGVGQRHGEEEVGDVGDYGGSFLRTKKKVVSAEEKSDIRPKKKKHTGDCHGEAWIGGGGQG
jgi:hypothetical protein